MMVERLRHLTVMLEVPGSNFLEHKIFEFLQNCPTSLEGHNYSFLHAFITRRVCSLQFYPREVPTSLSGKNFPYPHFLYKD